MGSQITKAKIVTFNKWLGQLDGHLEKLDSMLILEKRNKFQKDQRPQKMKLHSTGKKHEWILSNFEQEDFLIMTQNSEAIKKDW